MNTRKNLLIVIGEWWEARRTVPSTVATSQKPGRVSRLIRWFLPNGGTLLLVLLLIATQSVWAHGLQVPAAPGPSATTVNYQGRLADSGGTPINGSQAMTFAIYDAATNGNLIWGPETHVAIPVSNGLFRVGLGSLLSIPTTTWNGDRYLEIQVGGETLSPRELIRSVPIAGMALTVPDGAISTAQLSTGAVTSSKMKMDSGTTCLSSDAVVNLANIQYSDVPGASLTFSLNNPSKVLVWFDGAARFSQTSWGEIDVVLFVDGTGRTLWYTDDPDRYFYSLKGQRILSLGAGNHTMSLRAIAVNNGTLTVRSGGPYQTCINYVVLGEQ